MRKLLGTAVALSFLASATFTQTASADVAAGALPNLGSATNADVTTTGNNMNIQINGGQGGVGTLKWNSFNVGKDAGVNYEFTAHNQTALNKVSATGGLSQIYGKITASGCANCGYDATGKVILLNPNGVLFGDGANVNLNSFTVSNLDGNYNEATKQLELVKGSNQTDFGIVVEKGASIYGDKAVNLAANNVTLYNGSKIATNVAPNFNNAVDSFGKVKIVTADGVNFAYYDNGAVKSLSNITNSADKMLIQLNGDIKSGNIDVRNHSTNADSEINLKEATLKATKAVSGNDGNIWLTANNRVIVENSKLETVNYSADAANRTSGGDIEILAGNKVSVGNSDLDAVGNINLTSVSHDIAFNGSTADTAKDVNLTAGNTASIQDGSIVNAKNVNVTGTSRAQIISSTVNAKNDVNLVSNGDMAWSQNASITAGNNFNAKANNGYLYLKNATVKANNDVNLQSKSDVTSKKLEGSTFTAGKDVNVTSTDGSVLLTSTAQFKPTSGIKSLTAAKNVEVNSAGSLTTDKTKINAGENIFLTSSEGSVTIKDTTNFAAGKKVYLTAKTDVKTDGSVDMNNIQTNINAGNDVNVNFKNVGNRNNGMIATAGNNMVVTTDGTLSVSSLISGKDMTINANKVIAGLPYTTETKLPEDLVSERSYIKVGGEFTSNVTNDNYTVTASGELTDDGKYNQKHHIQYGSDEKILLVNKRPVDNKVTDPNLGDADKGNDIDVIQPDDIDDNSTVTPPTDPSIPGTGDKDNPSNPEPGDKDNPSNPDPGDDKGDQEPCPDVPNEDLVEDEQTPGLVSVSNLLSNALTKNNK